MSENLAKLQEVIDRKFKNIDNIYGRVLESISDRDITFLEIGACDGVFPMDPLYPHSFTNKHWKGVLVEPIPYYFSKLKENYENRDNLQFVNCAITEEDCTIKMHTMPTELIEDGTVPYWSRGVSCVDPNNVKESIRGYLEEIDVEGITLETLFERTQLTKIDVLQIDVEGYDHMILTKIFDLGHRPALICVEYDHLPKEEYDSIIQQAEQYEYEIQKSGGDFILMNGYYLD